MLYNFKEIDNKRKKELLCLAQELHLKYNYENIQDLLKKEKYRVVEIEDCKEYQDIYQEFKELNIPGKIDKNTNTIYTLKNSEDVNFTIAHEFSHYLLGHIAKYRVSKHELDVEKKANFDILQSLLKIFALFLIHYTENEEYEADYLAYALLIPEDKLTDKLMSFNINEDFAKEFGFSFDILKKRVEQLRDIDKYHAELDKESRVKILEKIRKDIDSGKYSQLI